MKGGKKAARGGGEATVQWSGTETMKAMGKRKWRWCDTRRPKVSKLQAARDRRRWKRKRMVEVMEAARRAIRQGNGEWR